MILGNQAKELYLIIKASQRKYVSLLPASEKNIQKPPCGTPEDNTLVGYKSSYSCSKGSEPIASLKTEMRHTIVFHGEAHPSDEHIQSIYGNLLRLFYLSLSAAWKFQ